ncbi:PAS domain S-box protein [Paracoccus liaowanqingii]|uniref:histidine kinase n=2 Tax=Paracoccus liaowanqingii TaxID=2560053 RepID=A0A4Z1BXW8_9RHOB|nr:PAS domain S-box protein [Paracoccus liaowanqingii]
MRFGTKLDSGWENMKQAGKMSKARVGSSELAEEQQRLILNAIPQMVWSTRPDGYHDFYNDRWYEFTGVPKGTTDGEGWNDMFHPEDQERARSRWQLSLNTGDAYEIEYRLRHHSGVYRWTLGRALPVRDDTGAIVRWMGTCTDVDELKRTSDELRQTSALLGLIGDSTPDLIYAKDNSGRILYVNAAVQQAVGRPPEEILGLTDLDYAPDEAQARAIMAHDRHVIDTGQTLDIDEVYVGPEGGIRHYRSVKAPLRDEDNHVIGIVGVTRDVTKRREAEERERLLTREVDHRAKNMLAIIQSLVNLSRSEDPVSFRKAVTGRIQALARVHGLLSKSRWDAINLKELVDQELAAFAGKNMISRLAGPALRLPPASAQPLSLVLHELATNAAKYGAFSMPEGRVELDWTLEANATDQPLLRLTWSETGGPSVAHPVSKGFGSALISSSIEQLGGEIEFEWRETGLLCVIRVPAGKGIIPEAPPRSPRPPTASPAALAGAVVLLVEDEALIAMEMESMLLDAGCKVLGPASSVEAAMRLISDSRPEAALLDVSLGESDVSFAVADKLAGMNVPFAFCTGYVDASELPPRFKAAMILPKPTDRVELKSVLTRLVTAAS